MLIHFICIHRTAAISCFFLNRANSYVVKVDGNWRFVEALLEALCVAVSGNENAVSRLLKTESYRDRTWAGRVMEAVGKSQTYASQQMLV